MNIPVRGKVYELTEGFEYNEDDLYSVGSRFRVKSIRVTTQNNYISFSFPALVNKNSPLTKELKGTSLTISTEEFNDLKFVEVTDGK